MYYLLNTAKGREGGREDAVTSFTGEEKRLDDDREGYYVFV
jgi:hypothetical protein